MTASPGREFGEHSEVLASDWQWRVRRKADHECPGRPAWAPGGTGAPCDVLGRRGRGNPSSRQAGGCESWALRKAGVREVGLRRVARGPGPGREAEASERSLMSPAVPSGVRQVPGQVDLSSRREAGGQPGARGIGATRPHSSAGTLIGWDADRGRWGRDRLRSRRGLWGGSGSGGQGRQLCPEVGRSVRGDLEGGQCRGTVSRRRQVLPGAAGTLPAEVGEGRAAGGSRALGQDGQGRWLLTKREAPDVDTWRRAGEQRRRLRRGKQTQRTAGHPAA